MSHGVKHGFSWISMEVHEVKTQHISLLFNVQNQATINLPPIINQWGLFYQFNLQKVKSPMDAEGIDHYNKNLWADNLTQHIQIHFIWVYWYWVHWLIGKLFGLYERNMVQISPTNAHPLEGAPLILVALFYHGFGPECKGKAARYPRNQLITERINCYY